MGERIDFAVIIIPCVRLLSTVLLNMNRTVMHGRQRVNITKVDSLGTCPLVAHYDLKPRTNSRHPHHPQTTHIYTLGHQPHQPSHRSPPPTP
jgi:hypothetical protein